MLIDSIVRGNVIEWAASFLDAEGAPSEPDSVVLTVNFMGSTGRSETDITMSENTDGEWAGTWDSSEARKGRVHWAIRTYNPAAADEGRFDLTANLANPDEEATA